MNFKECVKYVESSRREKRDFVDLSTIKELLQRLQNPQNSFKSVHVAGTNGKGSVCSFIESALRKQGYKTGLFVSPYIEVFNERIQINRQNITDSSFAKTATKVIKTAEDMQSDGYPLASFFELITAIAFVIFKENKVDIAVVETGIGGTLDATNIINPIVSVITTIAYDHMNILGNTIDQIASNKAGIIKENSPVITALQKYDEAYAVLLNTAKEKNAPLFSVSKSNMQINYIGFDGCRFNFRYDTINAQIETKLIGFHQVQNAACAFLSLCVINQYTDVKLSSESILNGIKEAEWIARMEIVSKDPLTIIDGAHNVQAAEALVETINSFIPIGKVNVIFGVLSKKNYLPMAKIISKIAEKVYTVTIGEEGSAEGNMLAEELRNENIDAVCIGDLIYTYNKLRENNNIPVLICGSLYLSGKARKLFY